MRDPHGMASFAGSGPILPPSWRTLTPSSSAVSAVGSNIPYIPPDAFNDLHVLDLLELSGSQSQAGQALAMHQTTVCRSLRRLQDQFDLVGRPGRRSDHCRYGTNRSLWQLRLAYREHRLMRGLLRLSTDGLHQVLLAGLPMLQPVPPRFRSATTWAHLIQDGLLDGAIVSSYGHHRLPEGQQRPRWPGVRTLPLGTLALELVRSGGEERRVLLPQRAVALRLHGELAARGWRTESQPQACQEPASWLRRLHDRQLAMPVCPGLVGRGWLRLHGLRLLGEPPLVEQLWLLLPPGRQGHEQLARSLLHSIGQRLEQAGVAACQATAADHRAEA